MSNDDWSKYINGEIATTNGNNFALISAQKQLCESSLIALANIGVNYLVQIKKITSEQAKTLRIAIPVVDSVAKLFLSFFGC
jgi:hypothetical protein